MSVLYFRPPTKDLYLVDNKHIEAEAAKCIATLTGMDEERLYDAISKQGLIRFLYHPIGFCPEEIKVIRGVQRTVDFFSTE